MPPLKDRLPPHSVEAEQGVLGCLMLAPVECMPEVLAAIHSDEVFYDLRHRTIWQQMAVMHRDNLPIDTITLQTALKDRKKLDGIGGVAFLSSLPDQVPSAANLDYYLKMLCDRHKNRELIRVGNAIVQAAYEMSKPTPDLTNAAERDILAIGRHGAITELTPVRELVGNAIGEIEEDVARKGVPGGITTGFHDLDRLTGGLQKGELIILAARPSIGKTSMAMNIAEHVAIDLNKPVAVFSLEMSAQSLIKRSIMGRARVSARNLREGYMAEREVPRITHAACQISKAPLYIDDRLSGKTVHDLRAQARRLWQQYNIELFVIDYMQLMHGTNPGNRVADLEEISGVCKEMSREFNRPVLVLCQLNRELEKEKGRAPKISDARGCGAIEQDADQMWLLYNPKGDEDEDDETCAVNLRVGKNRNGGRGIVRLTFLKSYTRFESAARITVEDVPEKEPTMFEPADSAGKSYA